MEYGPIRDYTDAVRVLRENDITCMVGIPSQVYRLAKLAPEARPRTVLLSADYVPISVRKTVETIWGAEVFDHYGLTEAGLAGGVECHAHEGYHMRDADMLFEIIDPETGERYSYCQTTEHLTPNNWHCYGLEWTADYIRGYLDGVEYFYAPNPKDGQAPYSWPFDQKFYLKLNLAIGGSWGGTVDPHFQEETFEVDWVRVYQK